MSILKLKAFIYKLTGIYLADKEEATYINSAEFSKAVTKYLAADPEENIEFIRSLLIGEWQIEHGFYRGVLRGKIRRLKDKIIGLFIKTYCKDCGVRTKYGPGSARCLNCWSARIGVENESI